MKRSIILASFALSAPMFPSVAAWADDSGARAGVEAMSCEQISGELMSAAQQMMPDLQAMMQSQARLNQQSMQMGNARRVENTAINLMATPSTLDPTGTTKRAYQAALMAQHAKEEAENQALLNSPEAKRFEAQSAHFTAAGAQAANARTQELMRIGQQKGCFK